MRLLPPELLCEILSYVPPYQRLCLRSVSKDWNQVVNDEIVRHTRSSQLTIKAERVSHFRQLQDIVFKSSSMCTVVDSNEKSATYYFALADLKQPGDLEPTKHDPDMSYSIWNYRYFRWEFEFSAAVEWDWIFGGLVLRPQTEFERVWEFEARLSNEIPSSPTCIMLVHKDGFRPVIDGTPVWCAVKVPLKILAHYFAARPGGD